QRFALAVVALLTVVTPLITALAPLPLKLLVDHALIPASAAMTDTSVLNHLPLPQSRTALIAAATGASLALFLLASLLEACLTFAWSSAGQRMVADLAADLFHHMQRLTPLFHTRTSVGDLLSRL